MWQKYTFATRQEAGRAPFSSFFIDLLLLRDVLYKLSSIDLRTCPSTSWTRTNNGGLLTNHGF